ncbi:isoprenylcysteine alpha-carbonyl methylesterase ICMEL2-like protein [Hapsidospora chrysogenum ATCC 11550]|uniref:Isoprenylcysteine alpha-carbonyl methylesterase ICMEL2-like protein n=1 Tax=Hapsidospora chrysogenum (strain ATCC 11550 / CBS 779.69 / DSM 880 / IAM 14645 / JCM 23072 / IMI 49137) TaxID=857340 RepID=A0A086SVD4_HAPC1|nr:isoprenylcysteine alpha-carbonyl methylesterase ICMEL2-like protein [Hapsidospora chrysogenum ATCC 11550]
MNVPSDPKLDGFDVLQTTYKTVQGHGIRVDILIPKKPSKPGKHPVIVRFHGGAWAFGDSLYMDWWPAWTSDLALEHDAVIISPNYRLMPESTTNDILEDLEDFWTWLYSPALGNILASHATPTEIDLERIITAGESAGGHLSLVSALSHRDRIRAALASYPATDIESRKFTVRDSDNPPFGQNVPEEVVTAGLEAYESGNPVSSTSDPARLGFAVGLIEHGKMGRLFARGNPRDDLYPMKSIEKPGARIPRGGLAIVHGKQDSVVPASDTERFVARAREVFKGAPGGDKIVLAMREGEHGFDTVVRYEEQWIRDTFKDAVETWLE